MQIMKTFEVIAYNANSQQHKKKQRFSGVLEKWYKMSDVLSVILLVIVLWLIAMALFTSAAVGFNTRLFKLAILFITAKIGGAVCSFVKLPPMLGMLLVGMILRNVDYVSVSPPYLKFISVLRQFALISTMLPAGLGLDQTPLKKFGWNVFNLAFIPPCVEVFCVTIASHILLDFPWSWAVLLGLGLASVSSPVIAPYLFQLQADGFGAKKDLHTLIISTSTLNCMTCIVLYGIVVGIIFNEGEFFMKLVYAPTVIAIGFAYGVTYGTICRFVPHQSETFLVALRTLLLIFGILLAAVGGPVIGYGAVGSVACIASCLTASYGWRKQGWTCNNGVRENLLLIWKFFEPISFGLIGMEVDFSIIELTTVYLGIILMTFSLLIRMAISFIFTQRMELNFKENIFFAMCWIPKATVQAALCPLALDTARLLNNETALPYANSIITIVVVSIFVTSPIGAFLVMQFGRRLLNPTTVQQPQAQLNGVSNLAVDAERN